MRRIRVAALKTILNEALAPAYGIPGLTACPMMTVGQVFYVDYVRPKGFCAEGSSVWRGPRRFIWYACGL